MVDSFQFADDVQSNLREFVLQEVKEERQQVLDSGVLAKEWRKAGDLVGHSRAYMLGAVLAEVPDARNDTK